MKRYKEEVDALHASDALKQQIAALPQNARPAKKTSAKRIAAIAAVLVVILVAGVVSTPLLFSAQKAADRIAPEEEYAYSAANGAQYYSKDSFAPEDAAAEIAVEKYGMQPASAPVPALPANRKLIRNAELRVETKAFDDFHAAVLQKVEALKGYVESSETGAYYSNARYENLTLRIPAESLDAFLQSVAELGTVTEQSTSVQDVTDDYVDVQSRLAALETEQETLLALLKKAEKLSDILEIQDRLTEVRGTLESYKAKLQSLDGQIAYSAVEMTVSEVERITPAESKSFFTQVRQNLSENLYSIGQGARNFAIWFLSSLPYFALWLVLIGVIVVVVIAVRRRRRRK